MTAYKKKELNNPLFHLHVRIQTILKRIFRTPEHAFIGYYNNVGYESNSFAIMFEKSNVIVACSSWFNKTKVHPANIIVEVIFNNTPEGLIATKGREVEEIDLDTDEAAYQVIEYLLKPILAQDQCEYIQSDALNRDAWNISEYL